MAHRIYLNGGDILGKEQSGNTVDRLFVLPSLDKGSSILFL